MLRSHHDGFTLVGTGQRPCADSPAPSATGLMAHFDARGALTSPEARFTSRMYGTVRAFQHRGDTFVITAPYADSTQLTITARRHDGAVDPRFGNHGHARIRTPWSGRDAALGTEVSVHQTRPDMIATLATEDGRNQVQIVRLRLGE
jgi:hypothetical protein